MGDAPGGGVSKVADSRFLRAPIADAAWYSGFGVPLFVLGMMASAVAVRVFAAA